MRDVICMHCEKPIDIRREGFMVVQQRYIHRTCRVDPDNCDENQGNYDDGSIVDGKRVGAPLKTV